MKNFKTICILILFMSVFLMAGGPWYRLLDNSGIPMKWKDSRIEWYSDENDLNADFDNTKAVQMVQNAFNTWLNGSIFDETGKPVNVVGGLTVEYKGSVGEKITVDNYKKYTQEDDSDAKTVIIFDNGGKILDDMGLDYYGLTPNPALSGDGMTIARNFIIINGTSADDTQKYPISKDAWQSLITHEVGHLLNLDHSAVNYDIGEDCGGEDGCEDATLIPTMFPFDPIREMQWPIIDDIIAMAFMYPSNDFSTKFCTIEGEIQANITGYDACPVQGVHVVARREEPTMNRIDSRGFVSGVLYWPCEANGKYILKGIIPGKNYKVFYEQTPRSSGGSSYEPLAEYSPIFEGFAYIKSGDSDVVKCSAGGETIAMDTTTIDLNTYACAAVCSQSSAGKSGCSLRKSK